MDVAFLGLIALLGALSLGLIALCQWVMGGGS